MEDKTREMAEAFADRIDDGQRTARQCAVLAYMKGAEGRAKAAWHPADELPEHPEKGIVIVTKVRRRFVHATFNGVEPWNAKKNQKHQRLEVGIQGGLAMKYRRRGCYDCLWRDEPHNVGNCPTPDEKCGEKCPKWEWRYE